jgi:hypothetical protein
MRQLLLNLCLTLLVLSFSAACAMAQTTQPVSPLPSRMVNVVPHGKTIEAEWTPQTVYLELGWTPQTLKAELAKSNLDEVIRVGWSNDLLGDGAKSRWFTDIEALLDAGFKVVIATHTNLNNSSDRFQHYDSAREGDLAIADRTRESAPTWTLFMDNWDLIIDRFGDHPGVVGFEPFNEPVPLNKKVSAGRGLMRDIGGWMDRFESRTVGKGKHVFIEGPWATTSFWALRNQVDDRGRTLPQMVAGHRGLVHPAVHVYGWYGKPWHTPGSLNDVRLLTLGDRIDETLEKRLRAQHAAYLQSYELMQQFNRLAGTELREWDGEQAEASATTDALRTLLKKQREKWDFADKEAPQLNMKLTELAGTTIDLWTGHFAAASQARQVPEPTRKKLAAILEGADEQEKIRRLEQYAFDTRYQIVAETIDTARSVSGIGTDELIWISEVGTSSFTFEDRELKQRLDRAHFRAMMQAGTDRKASICLWHAIGPDGSFAILPAFGEKPTTGQSEMLREFLIGR